jgi:hypothetical protein
MASKTFLLILLPLFSFVSTLPTTSTETFNDLGYEEGNSTINRRQAPTDRNPDFPNAFPGPAFTWNWGKEAARAAAPVWLFGIIDKKAWFFSLFYLSLSLSLTLILVNLVKFIFFHTWFLTIFIVKLLPRISNRPLLQRSASKPGNRRSRRLRNGRQLQGSRVMDWTVYILRTIS